MKIGLITMEAFDNRPIGSVGSSRIRMRWLLKYWPEAEEYRIGKKYDVLVFQKVYWPDMLKKFDGIKIMDICDPDWLEGKPVMEYIGLCDACVTSTDALAEYIKKFVPNKPVVCIPDRVELVEFPFMKKTHREVIKDAVWFGYSHNFKYVEMAVDALITRKINLTVVSEQPMSIPTGYPGLQINNVKYSQDTLNDYLLGADVVLLPDPSDIDVKGRYKSNNKVIQAWALGMPVIRVEDDLDRLMDRSVRIKESLEKRKLVEELYNVEISVKQYKALIDALIGQRGNLNSS